MINLNALAVILLIELSSLNEAFKTGSLGLVFIYNLLKIYKLSKTKKDADNMG